MSERDRNRRLVAKYGITSVEYDERLKEQGGGCAICGSTGKSRRLHVEHDHKWKQAKLVYVHKTDGDRFWRVYASYNDKNFCAEAATRRVAAEIVRRHLKRASIRGICCFSCNGGLRKFRDSPLFMERAAKYITRFTQNEQRV